MAKRPKGPIRRLVTIDSTFYNAKDWEDKLLNLYVDIGEDLLREQLKQPIKKLTTLVSQLVEHCSHEPITLINFLSQIINPWFQENRYNEQVVHSLIKSSVEEKREDYVTIACSQYAIRAMYERNINIYKLILKKDETLFKDEYNNIANVMRMIIIEHVKEIIETVQLLITHSQTSNVLIFPNKNYSLIEETKPDVKNPQSSIRNKLYTRSFVKLKLAETRLSTLTQCGQKTEDLQKEIAKYKAQADRRFLIALKRGEEPVTLEKILAEIDKNDIPETLKKAAKKHVKKEFGQSEHISKFNQNTRNSFINYSAKLAFNEALLTMGLEDGTNISFIQRVTLKVVHDKAFHKERFATFKQLHLKPITLEEVRIAIIEESKKYPVSIPPRITELALANAVKNNKIQLYTP